jgi:ferredoxin-NADP reductase
VCVATSCAVTAACSMLQDVAACGMQHVSMQHCLISMQHHAAFA